MSTGLSATNGAKYTVNNAKAAASDKMNSFEEKKNDGIFFICVSGFDTRSERYIGAYTYVVWLTATFTNAVHKQ